MIAKKDAFEFFLARRYLSSRRGRGLSAITWIALAGVIVGVMSLVTVLGVMSGFERELRSKILGNNAHILVQIADLPPSESLTNIIKKVEAVEGVASAMPAIYGEGFILSPSGESEGVLVKGIDAPLADKVLDLKSYTSKKTFEGFAGRSSILGITLADKLSLRPGDSYTLVLNKGEFSPFGLMPKMVKLNVLDTFHSGMTQFDGRHAYLPLSIAEKIFDTKAHMIEVKAKDPRDIPIVRDRLRGQIEEAIQVQDWISANQDFLTALKLEKTAMAVILGLIVLVASFNICGSLIMVVKDKSKDIAILKSMGALDREILKIFFYQGIFIGSVGTFFGILGGLGLSAILRDFIKFPLNKEVYMIDTLPVDLRLSDIVFVAIGALLISALATLYPARLAAQINPTEGLKAD